MAVANDDLPYYCNAFFEAADLHGCWIGLRQPNALAERWIGRGGYKAKDEHCKAKTADNASFRFGGLVVNPHAFALTEAFTSFSVHERAVQAWDKWMRTPEFHRRGFVVTEIGPETGVVRHGGCRLYSDLDLMALARANESGKIVVTTDEEEAELYRQVKVTINTSLGLDLVLHGSEFMPFSVEREDGAIGELSAVGAKASESVVWFGPRRQKTVWPSSMPPSGH